MNIDLIRAMADLYDTPVATHPKIAAGYGQFLAALLRGEDDIETQAWFNRVMFPVLWHMDAPDYPRGPGGILLGRVADALNLLDAEKTVVGIRKALREYRIEIGT